jgi:hypothetical protein
VWTVKLNTASIRRQGQRMELDDLRLGQDIRVTGATRGPKTVEASLVEVVRNIDGPGGVGRPNRDDRPDRPVLGNTRSFEGKVLNVGEARKAFRVDVDGEETRFQITDETVVRRGNVTSSFSQVREGARVRVEARRRSEEWVAVRVTLL